MRPRNIHCWVYRSDSTDPEWCRPLAFRSKNNAHTISRARPAGSLFRAYRAYPTDHARCSAWRICVGGAVVPQQESNCKSRIKQVVNTLHKTKTGEFANQFRPFCFAISPNLVSKLGEIVFIKFAEWQPADNSTENHGVPLHSNDSIMRAVSSAALLCPRAASMRS